MTAIRAIIVGIAARGVARVGAVQSFIERACPVHKVADRSCSHPIEVSGHSVDKDKDGQVFVGDQFADAQGRSVIVQIGGKEPGAGTWAGALLVGAALVAVEAKRRRRAATGR